VEALPVPIAAAAEPLLRAALRGQPIGKGACCGVLAPALVNRDGRPVAPSSSSRAAV